VVESVLVCDLARPRNRGLAAQLVQCGYLVEVAATAEQAHALLRTRPFACVLIRVEDGQGIELCASLRSEVTIPLVVACATRNEALAVRYLKNGAERVLTGPLSRRVLEARLGATLSGPYRAAQRRTAAEATCSVGDLFIDAPRHQVTRNGRFVSLTPTEFRLLVALARRPGTVVSHHALLSEVWGGRLEQGHEVLRQNTRGVGYRLAHDAA